jgi:uncharacterized repeat protein (TIGR04138 family)
MLDPNHPIAILAREDGRYHVDAYTFVFDALHHAHSVLGDDEEEESESDAVDPEDEAKERHLTGQQLCAAIRHLALEQYGLLAKCVLNNWGVTCTGDFGNIVFSLIEVGQMRKTDNDRREDFDCVFDFDRELVEDYEITLPES